MTCPKCQGEMRTYERNGVHVDQCNDCRGLFLDRGELERLVDAEGSFYSEPSAPAPRPDQSYGEYEHRGKPHKKRKKTFLEELSDWPAASRPATASSSSREASFTRGRCSARPRSSSCSAIARQPAS